MMKRSPLDKCFDAFLDALAANDDDALGDAIEQLNIHYSGMTDAELYDGALHAHVVLFGGTKERIDSAAQMRTDSKNAQNKLSYLVLEMRESLPHRGFEDDEIIEKIYAIIGGYEEDHNNIWEALFTAAVKRREYLEDVFTARVDLYLQKLEKYNITGDPALNDALLREEADIQSNETMAHHYEFILRRAAFFEGIEKQYLDLAFALVCGDNLFAKYARLTSICYDSDFSEKLDEIRNQANEILEKRHLADDDDADTARPKFLN